MTDVNGRSHTAVTHDLSTLLLCKEQKHTLTASSYSLQTQRKGGDIITIKGIRDKQQAHLLNNSIGKMLIMQMWLTIWHTWWSRQYDRSQH